MYNTLSLLNSVCTPSDGDVMTARKISSQKDKQVMDPFVHPERTHKGQSYKFHPKHHYPSREDSGIWKRSISRDQEFMMFQDAETNEFSDESGNLFNVLKDEDNEFVTIGTKYEVVSKFWNPQPNTEWHGFPMWPIKTKLPTNRSKPVYGPSSEILKKMVDAEKITERDKARLLRGDFP